MWMVLEKYTNTYTYLNTYTCLNVQLSQLADYLLT